MKTQTIVQQIVRTFVAAVVLTFGLMVIARILQLPGSKILTDDANAFLMQSTSIVIGQIVHFWWFFAALFVLLIIFYRRNREKEKKRHQKRFTPAIYHDIRYEEYYDVDKVKIVRKRVSKRP